MNYNIWYTIYIYIYKIYLMIKYFCNIFLYILRCNIFLRKYLMSSLQSIYRLKKRLIKNNCHLENI